MKKFVAIVLSVLTLLTATVMFAHADAEVSIFSAVTSISAGSEIPVTVKLTGLENIAVQYSVTVSVSDSSMLDSGRSEITFSGSTMEFGEFSEQQELKYFSGSIEDTKRVKLSNNAVSDSITFTVTDITVYGVDETSGPNENLEWVFIYEKTDINASIGTDSLSVSVLAQSTSSEAPSEVSSATSSEEASSLVSSDILSSTVSDPFAVISSAPSGTSSDEDVFNTVTDASSDSPSLNTNAPSLNYTNNGGIGFGTILLIILFAFIAGLATMFIVTKVRNNKEDEDADNDDGYFGGYQQGFVMPVVKQEKDADEGYRTVEDDSDVKINDSKKPKFNINIEFDDSWDVKNDDEGVFEATEEEPKPNNDDIEPYYYDED